MSDEEIKPIEFSLSGNVISVGGNVLPPNANFIPPIGPFGVAPEPIPNKLTDEELMNALVYSPNAYVRNQMKTQNYNPDALIQAKGYDVLDSMKTFAAYYTPLHLLVASALYKNWRVVPKVNGEVVDSTHPRYERAAEIAKFVNYCCRNIVDVEAGYDRQDFRSVIYSTMEPAVHAGFSVQEIQYRLIKDGDYKGKMGFQRFIYREHKNVRFATDVKTDQVRSMGFYTPLGGWQTGIPRSKFLIYTFRQQKGYPYGHGLARVCYKHTFSIDTLTRLLGDALTRFGMGFIKATVNNPSQDYINKVQLLLQNVQNGAPLVVTPEIAIELMSLAGGGLDPIQKAIIYHKEEISTHILGQTLTTSSGAGAGSYSLAEVHEGTQKYFTGFPRRDIEVSMEHQPFTQLVMINYGPADIDCVPGLDLGVYDHEETAMVADYIGTLIDKGVANPNETWIRDRAGVPSYDPSTPTESILPDRIVERINIQENPDGSKVTTSSTTTGGSGGE